LSTVVGVSDQFPLASDMTVPRSLIPSYTRIELFASAVPVMTGRALFALPPAAALPTEVITGFVGVFVCIFRSLLS